MTKNPVERLKKRYTDEERSNALAALSANGGKDTRGALRKTANEIGVPFATLRSWAESRRHPEALLLSREKLLPLADRLESLAHRIVGVLEDEAKLRSAPVSSLAAALNACVDKSRLLREQSTSNTSSIHLSLTPEEKDRRIKEIQAAVAARRAVAEQAGFAEAAGPEKPGPEKDGTEKGTPALPQLTLNAVEPPPPPATATGVAVEPPPARPAAPSCVTFYRHDEFGNLVPCTPT